MSALDASRWPSRRCSRSTCSTRCCAARSCSHDRRRLDPDRRFVALLTALDAAVGGYMHARLHRRAGRARPRARRGPSGCSTALFGTDPEPRARLEGLRQAGPAVQPRRVRRALRDPAHAGRSTRGTRRTSDRRPWDLSFNTAASFVTNTNWQFYGGETTMSYFSQMAGLAVQNFLSAAVGIAVCIAVIRGFARRSTRRPRQLLGRRHADAALRAAADLRRRRAVPRLAGRAAEPRRLPDGRHDRRRRADARPRPGRLAGDHQGARDQRRRLLQRQRGASVREPERPDERVPHADDPASSRRG